jgi:hypothetical protein
MNDINTDEAVAVHVRITLRGGTYPPLRAMVPLPRATPPSSLRPRE